MRATRLLLLAALVTTVAACGDNNQKDPGATASATAVDRVWERIVPGGDCGCSDGSEFSFWTRQANPKKVVLYLEGGGACWSAKTCAPGSNLYPGRSDLYTRSIGADEGPAGQGGIFDFADQRNPFADYSAVFVPYCTGDVHLGNAVKTYAPGLTVHHTGYVNGTAALDQLAAKFPAATEVVVIGESAGSIAAPLYAALVSDRLPDARITVLADGSGSYPDVPRLKEITAVWGTGKALPDWFENPKEWSFPGLFIQSARHDSEIVFARHDYAYDEVQQFFVELIGIATGDLGSMIDGNESQIERAGVTLLSYIAPGVEHTVFSDGPFYTEAVDGRPFVDWVRRLIAGKPVADVHCTDCGAG